MKMMMKNRWQRRHSNYWHGRWGTTRSQEAKEGMTKGRTQCLSYIHIGLNSPPHAFLRPFRREGGSIGDLLALPADPTITLAFCVICSVCKTNILLHFVPLYTIMIILQSRETTRDCVVPLRHKANICANNLTQNHPLNRPTVFEWKWYFSSRFNISFIGRMRQSWLTLFFLNSAILSIAFVWIST